MNITYRTLGLVCLMLLSVAWATHAQVLVPIRTEAQPILLKDYQIDIQIVDLMAQVTITQVYFNPNNRMLEGRYLFPLSSSASVSGLSLCTDGDCTEGKLLDADEARQVYQDIVRQIVDPALLQSVGDRAFEVRVFPIPAQGEKTVQLRYQQVVVRRGNVAELILPSGQGAEQVTLAATIQSKDPIASVFSPSGNLSVNQPNDNVVELSFEARGSDLEKDLALYYTMTSDGMGFDLLAQRTFDENGYFTVLISPVEREDTIVLPKDIVFVFDVSGSMQGEKVEQARAALNHALDRLNPDDRFALVTFSDVIQIFAPSLVGTTEVDRGALQRFVDAIEAGGSTDLNAALLRGFRYFVDNERLKLLIFLTDGEATAGVTDTAEIVKNANEANDMDARLFTFGIGYDVNTKLLDQLSSENGGTTSYVTPGQSLERAIATFYEQVGTPLLSDLKIDFGGAEVYDLYPRTLPDLFKKSQLQLFGRFKQAGDQIITIKGWQGDEKVSYTFEVSFPEEDDTHPFVSRIWANRKVGHMLEQIRLYGETEELVNSIKDLALRFGIVTPYTSYLADPDAEESEFEGVMAAPQAVMDDSGRSAVQYSQSLKAMSESTSVSRTNITRWVEGEVFVQDREELWKPIDFDAEPDLIVKFGSPAYFWLAEKFALKNVLSLGTDLILPVDGKQVQINQTNGISETADLEGFDTSSQVQFLPDNQNSSSKQATEIDQLQRNSSIWWWVGVVVGVLSLVGIVIALKK